MASGPEHYRVAETLVEAGLDSPIISAPSILAAAQVHATLALAAATALMAMQDLPVMASPFEGPATEKWREAVS